MRQMRGTLSVLIPILIMLALCGMAMYVTGQDNKCATEINWAGECQP